VREVVDIERGVLVGGYGGAVGGVEAGGVGGGIGGGNRTLIDTFLACIMVDLIQARIGSHHEYKRVRYLDVPDSTV
jgi:hypothetical protein